MKDIRGDDVVILSSGVNELIMMCGVQRRDAYLEEIPAMLGLEHQPITVLSTASLLPPTSSYPGAVIDTRATNLTYREGTQGLLLAASLGSLSLAGNVATSP